MTLTTVTLARADQPITVTAETTTNPHLVIAPSIHSCDQGDTTLSDLFVVVHTPTGYTIPTGVLADLHSVRRFAAEIATHDWSFTDPAHLRTDAGQALRAAVVDAQRAADEVKPDAEDGAVAGALPRTAAGATADAVRAAQNAWKRWWDGDEQVPKQHLDNGDGSPNHLYMALLLNALYAFDRAYLYGALERIDPRAADSAACWLAKQHEYGDTVGEHLWEWNEQVERGERPRLPGALPAAADPADVALAAPGGTDG